MVQDEAKLIRVQARLWDLPLGVDNAGSQTGHCGVIHDGAHLQRTGRGAETCQRRSEQKSFREYTSTGMSVTYVGGLHTSIFSPDFGFLNGKEVAAHYGDGRAPTGKTTEEPERHENSYITIDVRFFHFIHTSSS